MAIQIWPPIKPVQEIPKVELQLQVPPVEKAPEPQKPVETGQKKVEVKKEEVKHQEKKTELPKSGQAQFFSCEEHKKVFKSERALKIHQGRFHK